MPFQKVEYEFPHDEDNELTTEIEIEPSSEIEVDLSGGTETQVKEQETEENLLSKISELDSLFGDVFRTVRSDDRFSQYYDQNEEKIARQTKQV